jgi:hypothetical protein
MSDTFRRVLVSYLIFLSVFWVGVKCVLKSNGFPFTVVWSFKDFDYLHQLIRRETNESCRSIFRGLLFGLYALVVLFPIVPLLLAWFAP